MASSEAESSTVMVSFMVTRLRWYESLFPFLASFLARLRLTPDSDSDDRWLRVKADREQTAWEERWPASWNPSHSSKVQVSYGFSEEAEFGLKGLFCIRKSGP
ncbi:hypothetical protein L1987_08802 [Smallanthus sonchifolius]|uniref:Uncharacterized protein n=1 Tax=Smallanthus sonchifolius TaxID=185202 RepID=A0ACB9JNU8_9ASTR|nr:hypothetical protein L1987_08802 [Smallanthus sonchifolius]